MLLPHLKDVLHKAMLYRLLVTLADDISLMRIFRFKGGTCAAMMGYINRFSVDLDFDFMGTTREIPDVRKTIERHAKKLGFTIKDSSKKGIQYFFKYAAMTGRRNTIKIDAVFPIPKNNLYKPFYFSEIGRTLSCQTVETMFANKLVSILDRYEKYNSIAGRDLYDTHAFFLRGLSYHAPIIEERRKMNVKDFFTELIAFIEKHFTETIITQDLNMLLPRKEFQIIREILIPETLMLLKENFRTL